MLLERGILVSYEAIRRWALKFGPDYACRLKRKAAGGHDIWHLDEVVISINGEKRYLWRAVDQEGYVLDELVQVHRNTEAARRLLTRLLRKQGRPPKRIITDKLGSDRAARRKVMPKVEHRQHKGLNNRAENSHVPDPKAGADDAGISILAGVAAVRLNLLRPPQSFHSAPFPSLRSLHPPSSSESYGGMEIRHGRSSLKLTASIELRPAEVRTVTSPPIDVLLALVAEAARHRDLGAGRPVARAGQVTVLDLLPNYHVDAQLRRRGGVAGSETVIKDERGVAACPQEVFLQRNLAEILIAAGADEGEMAMALDQPRHQKPATTVDDFSRILGADLVSSTRHRSNAISFDYDLAPIRNIVGRPIPERSGRDRTTWFTSQWALFGSS